MGQDARGKAMLKEIINELHVQGKLVLCILHDMDFVAETFGRTIIMSNGQLLFDGPTRIAFSEADILHTARLEQPHITQLARKMGYDGILLKENEINKSASTCSAPTRAERPVEKGAPCLFLQDRSDSRG